MLDIGKGTKLTYKPLPPNTDPDHCFFSWAEFCPHNFFIETFVKNFPEMFCQILGEKN
jgi:hypothetical protein